MFNFHFLSLGSDWLNIVKQVVEVWWRGDYLWNWFDAIIHCKTQVDSLESVFLTSNINASQCICSGKHECLQQTDVWRVMNMQVSFQPNSTAVDSNWLKLMKSSSCYCSLCGPPYCCDVRCVSVDELRLDGSCLSYRFGILLLMTVPLHVAFFSRFRV